MQYGSLLKLNTEAHQKVYSVKYIYYTHLLMIVFTPHSKC